MVDGSCWGRRLFLLFLAISGQLVIGPRPSHGPRDRSDLILGRVTAQTASVRTKLLNDFEAWLVETASWTQSFSALARQDPIWATELLEEYGMVLYEQGSSRRNFAETINICQQKCPYLKTMLAGAWQIATTWENLFPSELHAPVPLPLLKAMASVALSWGWNRLVALLLIGFYALLRPVELCCLKVEHFTQSTESGNADIMIIRLLQTKSRTRGARHQSVRLDEPYVIAFLEKCFRSMIRSERIWPHTATLFRTRFDQVLVAACGQSKLVLPSSLRPGGATFLFQRWGENIPRLQWRGRWMHLKTMLHYIQELGTINVMNKLTLSQRQRVHQLALLLEPCLRQVVVVIDVSSLVASALNASRS